MILTKIKPTKSDISLAIAIIESEYDTTEMSLQDIHHITSKKFDAYDILLEDITDYYQLLLDIKDKKINYKMNT